MVTWTGWSSVARGLGRWLLGISYTPADTRGLGKRGLCHGWHRWPATPPRALFSLLSSRQSETRRQSRVGQQPTTLCSYPLTPSKSTYSPRSTRPPPPPLPLTTHKGFRTLGMLIPVTCLSSSSSSSVIFICLCDNLVISGLAALPTTSLFSVPPSLPDNAQGRLCHSHLPLFPSRHNESPVWSGP